MNVDLCGAIQVLRNAGNGNAEGVGAGGCICQIFLKKKSVTKVYGSMLLALRGGWGGDKFPDAVKTVT